MRSRDSKILTIKEFAPRVPEESVSKARNVRMMNMLARRVPTSVKLRMSKRCARQLSTNNKEKRRPKSS